MAQPPITRFTERKIASAIQGAIGTPAVVDPALHGWRMYNGQSQLEVDSVEDNPDSPFYQGDDFAATNERGHVEGEVRLVPPSQPGDASDGVPECDIALRTAGMARTLDPLKRTTRYTPVSSGFEAATHQWVQSGLHTKLSDAQASIGEIALEIGQKAKATGVRLQGFVEEFDEADIGAVVVADGTGPTMQKTNSRQRITIDGGAPLPVWAKKHGLSLNTTMSTEEWTEHGQTSIPRKPAWSAQIAKTDLGDLNPRTIRRDGEIVEIVTRLTGASGLYVELYTRGKLRDFTQSNVNENMHFDLGGPTRVGTADDDFYIEFGDATFRLNGVLDGGKESDVYDAGLGLGVSGDHVGPVTYAVTDGALPDGLALDAATGAVTGTPTVPNTFIFTITATDSTTPTPQTASEEFTVVIDPA